MRAINTFLTLKILANCQMSTGSLMTRQTYDRAPRLTKLATAHISKGGIAKVIFDLCFTHYLHIVRSINTCIGQRGLMMYTCKYHFLVQHVYVC